MRIPIALFVLALAVTKPLRAGAQGAARPAGRAVHIAAVKDWRFWAGEAYLIGGSVLEAATTCRGFRHGLVENGPIGRGGQSCGTAWAKMGGQVGTDTILNLVQHKYNVLKPSGLADDVIAFSVPAAGGTVAFVIAARDAHKISEQDLAAARKRVAPEGN